MCRAWSLAPACGARIPTPASCRSIPRGPRRSPACWASSTARTSTAWTPGRKWSEDAPAAIRGTTAELGFITADKARFQGDLLGLVAAVDRRTAERAVGADRRRVRGAARPCSRPPRRSPRPHRSSTRRWQQPGARRQPGVGRRRAGLRRGRPDLRGDVSVRHLFHHPMEPASSFVAYATPDEAELWAPTEKPYGIAEPIATLLASRRRCACACPTSAAASAPSSCSRHAGGDRVFAHRRPPDQVRRHRRGELSRQRAPRHELQGPRRRRRPTGRSSPST